MWVYIATPISGIGGELRGATRFRCLFEGRMKMKIWHLVVALLIAYFAIWSSNNVAAIGSVVGNS